jgi:DNA-binding NarL/FixJ family response regulator
MTRIVLINKSPFIRSSICAVLNEPADLSVVGEAASIHEVIQLDHQSKPDVVLLGICSTDVDSHLLTAVSCLCEQWQELKLLIQVSSNDCLPTDNIHALLSHGAVGCILKEESSQSLICGIRAVMAGQILFSRKILEYLILGDEDKGGLGSVSDVVLTNQERAVLKGLALGMSNSYIAKELVLSNQTVRNYLTRVYSKLNIGSRNQAIIWARENGFHGD